MKVKSEREVAQSCPTLRDPMDCSPPDSSTHGIFHVRVLEWGAIAFSICKDDSERKYYKVTNTETKDHFKWCTEILKEFNCHCG